jgi:hypothetical protein
MCSLPLFVLQVAKDFVLEYEEKEKINADRLTHQVDRHISTLKTLRSKLETRHDLKTRTEEYRNWQRGFLPKKHAVMVGKTLEEFEATLPPKTANLADPDAEIDDEAMRKGNVAWLPCCFVSVFEQSVFTSISVRSCT